jgi:hypothetical protein
MRHKAIIDIFNDYGKREVIIWDSPDKSFDGTLLWFWSNGNFREQAYYNRKTFQLDGHNKIWSANGTLEHHEVWKNGIHVKTIL